MIRVLANLVCCERSLPGFQMATFSPRSHKAFFLCACKKKENSLVLPSLPIRTPILLDWAPRLKLNLTLI